MALAQERVVYMYSKNLLAECNRLPSFKNRALVVQDLINSYKILLDDKFLVVQSEDATEDELKSFHSSAYIDFLKKVNDQDIENIDDVENDLLEFGLSYDCPLLERNYDLVRCLAGGSISAAKLLSADKCKAVINWFGGWHHGQRDSAEGFCYVNDIVIAIQELSKTFKKVLYVDLDIHHGNGVQNAFEYSNKILTLSFHKKVVGFFPGSGDIEDIGMGKGKYYSLNVPLKEGICHENYIKLFSEIYNRVFTSFQPNAVVVQCGADGLSGDPIGKTNLTLETFQHCVKEVLKCNLPTLFLGGGGYNFPNTARLWTYLTSVIANIRLDMDIPDCCEYFTKYGPSYELQIDPTLQKDENMNDYINFLIETIDSYCSYIQ